ncbi:hypothetical protein cyc_05121 [Cyclospora cayetanensis]|uniref:Uncharacterized protein n=1 Tax=Cyclospora cayetanensis TaxID=88456 RepID=A0A1D3D802_9EIME|nr:hypothetical protein cyc_05121 [Cyclospora cayetanensis]
MELPDLSLGWLVFLVLFVGAAGAAGYLVLQEMRSSREKDIVLKQAGKEVDTSPPAREIEDYEEKRSALFQQLLVQQRVTEADEDLGEGQPPCKSWQRQLLQPEEKKALKLLLMRRALANTPRWFVLSGEANAKYRLYRNGLLTETAWSEFQAVQEELNEELQYIKLEAECMEEGWGDKVLKDTVMLFKLSEAQKERNKVMGAQASAQMFFIAQRTTDMLHLLARRHRARAAAAVAVAAGGKCPHTWGVGLKASHVPVQCTFALLPAIPVGGKSPANGLVC